MFSAAELINTPLTALGLLFLHGKGYIENSLSSVIQKPQLNEAQNI